MKELSRTEAREKIDDFFLHIENKNKEGIKKIKRLASHYHIRLADKRKLFCKYCFSTKLRVRKIKKKIKTVECENCKKLIRWKIV